MKVGKAVLESALAATESLRKARGSYDNFNAAELDEGWSMRKRRRKLRRGIKKSRKEAAKREG